MCGYLAYFCITVLHGLKFIEHLLNARSVFLILYVLLNLILTMVSLQLYKSYIQALEKCLIQSEKNISDRKNALCVISKANIY